jgi:hypothetical protein
MRPLQQSKSCLEAHASHWPDELKGFNGFIGELGAKGLAWPLRRGHGAGLLRQFTQFNAR